jgi:hypothetical protein
MDFTERSNAPDARISPRIDMLFLPRALASYIWQLATQMASSASYSGFRQNVEVHHSVPGEDEPLACNRALLRSGASQVSVKNNTMIKLARWPANQVASSSGPL